ncbi:MAG TPA: FAD:protein FMN transferase [Anaeromyxobacter sp.]
MPSLTLLALLLAADLPGAVPLSVETREMMATRVTVALVGVSGAEAERAFQAAFGAFERVEEAMNEWRPGSPLDRINRGAGRREPVPAPADLCEVLRIGLEGARRTGGLFDPTWAALRDVWTFDGSHRGTVPPREAVARRCKLVAHRRVQIAPRPAGCAVRLPVSGMRLGLGGLAKGWGVDRAVERLRALGLRSFFVQAGGDLYAAGKRGDRPWRVGIRDPRGGPDDVLGQLEVTDAAFSTSGDYERWFEVGGVRYHHIIDPRTCEPARASRQSTVLARTATDAEILTKATFILGGEKGLALAEQSGAGAVIVDAEGHMAVSPSLAGRIWWNERGRSGAAAQGDGTRSPDR